MSRLPGPHDAPGSWDTPTLPMPQRPSEAPAVPQLPRAGDAGGGAGVRSAPPWMPPRSPSPSPPPVPSPMPGYPRPGRIQPPPPLKRNWRRIARYSLLVLLAALLVIAGVVVHRLNDFGSAISTQAPFSTQTGYMSGLGRENLLVLGYGGGSHDGANLTDSMMVLSLVPQNGATTMISVPRDLWVQVPPNSGQYAKLNTAYQDGLANGYNGTPPGRRPAASCWSTGRWSCMGRPIGPCCHPGRSPASGG